MTPRVTTRPTHHLALSDGITTIGLTLTDPRGNPDPRAIRQSPIPKTSLQTTQGDPDYGSFVLPYVNIVQKDWSGGLGWLEYNKDSTRYLYGKHINTVHGDMIMGPKETVASLPAAKVAVGSPSNLDAQYEGLTMFPSGNGTGVTVVSKYQGTGALVSGFYITVKTSVSRGIYGKLKADSAGTPGSDLVSVYLGILPANEWTTLFVPLNYTLAGGTYYWLGVYGFGHKTDEYLTIKAQTGAAGYTTAIFLQTVWAYENDKTLTYDLMTTPPHTHRLFEYYNQLYVVRNFLDNTTAPQLFRNGYHARALANTGELAKLKTSLSLAGKDLAGCIAKIISGPGSEEAQNWRQIVSNTTTGTNDTITVAPPWNITHTTDTEFVILGTDIWTEVTGHGLTNPVTDILPIDDYLYFAQGDKAAIRRAKYAAGTVTWTFAAESNIDATYKGATFIEMIPNTEGKRKVWLAQATISKVYSADVVAAFGTAMTYSTTAIICGNPRSRITNLIPYGQPQIPWVLKEDQFGAISNEIFAPVPLTEMAAVKDHRNGRAATQFGVYLFFSLLDGFERYYDNRLDDMGPNRDQGMAPGHEGDVSCCVPYPGGILVGVDAGTNNASSICWWNQLGWHEIYHADASKSITDMMVQVLPGNTLDRLWFTQGSEVAWIPITLQPDKEGTNYPLTTRTSELITAWYKTSFAEINKFWRSLTLFTENLDANRTITVEYQTDEGRSNPWVTIGTFNTSPIQELPISASYNVTGKRIRFRFTFSATATPSPRLIAYTISAIVRIPPTNAWSVSCLAASYKQDQQGRWETLDETGLLAQLKTWANSKTQAAPITLTSEDPAYHNKRVFIDPASISPISITLEANGKARTVKALNFSMTEMEAV